MSKWTLDNYRENWPRVPFFGYLDKNSPYAFSGKQMGRFGDEARKLSRPDPVGHVLGTRQGQMDENTT